MKPKLLFFVMMLCALTVSAQGLSGTGTSNDPYLINTVDDLKWMRDQVNNKVEAYLSASYKLMANLDFAREGDWTPIDSFNGSFDGNNKIVRNIRINSPAESLNAGFFGYIENADIVNLGVEWIELSSPSSSDSYAGGITGRAENSTITNCYSMGNIASNSSSGYSYSYAGGIVGCADYSTITNCYSTGNITSSNSSNSPSYSYAGGIIGRASESTVNKCYNTGNIASNSKSPYAGGIIGYADYSTITNCYSMGNTYSDSSDYSSYSSYSGGIIGYASESTITNCYNTGNIASNSKSDYYSSYDSSSYAGGIIGYASVSTVTNCYCTGNISSDSKSDYYSSYDSSSYSGGIIGYASESTIINCIALNDFIVATNLKTNNCYVGRITGNGVNNFGINYASSSIMLATGTSVSQLAPITDVTGDKNGQELKGSLIDLLNEYVDNNKCSSTGQLLYPWRIDSSVNNGLPIHNYTSPSINFELKGTGADSDPYLIYTYNDLLAAAIYINTYQIYSNKSYKLMSDIDLAGENDWIPIGISISKGFNGSFDGNNKIVRNIKIGTTESPTKLGFASFFGAIKNAEVANLGVDWIELSSYSSYVGGIIGRASESTVTNCYSTGNISSSNSSRLSNAGGIIGHAYESTITNCYSTGNISSSNSSRFSYVGGIIGRASRGAITNCYSMGTIFSSTSSGLSYVGGIIGFASESTNVNNCIALNTSISAICFYSDSQAFATRIGYKDGSIGVFSENYACKDMVVKIGTSDSNLNSIVPFGENHGDNLKAEPVNLLNNWVNTNSNSDNFYLSWVVIEGINNGYPVFADMVTVSVAFETNEGSAINPTTVKYGELITKPTDPTRDDYDFVGWHKDAECTQLWDFDNDRIYSNTTLYAKWNSATSIEDMNSDGIVVYSASSKIIVKNSPSAITVYSITGAVVRAIQQPGDLESIDIEPGYYIVKTGETSTKVIVY